MGELRIGDILIHKNDDFDIHNEFVIDGVKDNLVRLKYIKRRGVSYNAAPFYMGVNEIFNKYCMKLRRIQVENIEDD